MSSRHPAVKHRMSPAAYDETIKKLHTETGAVGTKMNTKQTKREQGSTSRSALRRLLPPRCARLAPQHRQKNQSFGRSKKTKSSARLSKSTAPSNGSRLQRTFLTARTLPQCLQRWNKVLRPGLQGPWTPNEDHRLVSCVKKAEDSKGLKVSDLNWSEVAEQVPGRSAKQCRERWCFNLDPTINRDPWTKAEDKKLLEMQIEHGNKWAFIASAAREDRECHQDALQELNEGQKAHVEA